MKHRLAPILFVCALAGCSKIHDVRQFSVDATESKTFKISPPVSEQKLKVAMTSDQPVNVWVVLKKDVPPGKEDFDPATMKTGVLASSQMTKDANLDVTVPAQEEYWIIVNGAIKKATGTIKIDSQ